jgi:OmpA-OmpF porin, OOP family
MDSRTIAITAALTALAGPLAHADAGKGGVYVGASVGYTQSGIFDGADDALAATSGLPVASSNEDESSDGTEAFIGVRFGSATFLRFLALEAGFVDLGNFSYDANLDDGGDTTPENVRIEVEPRGWHYGGIAFIPVTERLEVFARGGVFDWKSKSRTTAADRNNSGNFTTQRDTQTGTDPYYGGGLSWEADKHWSVRAEWRRFEGDGDEVDLISAGGAFHF